MKKNVLRLAYMVLAGLVAICVYIGFIPVYVGNVTSGGKGPVDPRIYAREKLIERGDILDRRGRQLARSVQVDNGYAREYPLGAAAAHITGYYSSRFGAAGLEKSMARVLMGMEGGNRLDRLLDRILNRPGKGNDVILTVDAELQERVYGLLEGKKGAVVVMDPRTGQVLAMTGYPSYNPPEVEKYMERADSPLLNRATQGAYPPGSVFKIVTAAALLSNKPDMAGKTIACNGSLEVEGFILKDNAAHGNVDFHAAFSRSCNVAFASYGLSLEAETFYRQALDFGLTRDTGFPLETYTGKILAPGEMDGPELASAAIGQGHVLISPLYAALLACAVANNGVIMEPYIVSGYRSPDGDTRVVYPREWIQAVDPVVAAALKEEMVSVVRQGTGRSAAIPGITVAGKTGSAENPHGKAHAWFVGFAPAEEPRVVVAVVLENAGAGGTHAAPLAREIIRSALQR